MDDDRGSPAAASNGAARRPDLVAAVREIERHASLRGWNQPPRLYALVATDALMRSEPALASRAFLDAQAALTPVEQDDLPADEPLDELLARIEWPVDVAGCAVVLETVSLPADVAPPQAATGEHARVAAWVAAHPRREEGRLIVGVLRDGARAAALRWRSYDDPADLVVGPDLAPALAGALASTLEA